MTAPSPQTEAGPCIYAIGDIHGLKNKLQELMQQIIADAARHPENLVKKLVFLGDYIDRGPDSRGVIDYLLHDLPPAFTPIFLRGNHEDVLLRVLAGDTRLMASWMQFGGAACMASYGVNPFRPGILETPEILQEELIQKIPVAHIDFFKKTTYHHTCGDYYFAHAGVNPDIALENQVADDLLWIRAEFLLTRKNFGKIIIHGHTISPTPDIQPNRIGIDTGAYATGKLTCLKLYGGERQFFST